VQLVEQALIEISALKQEHNVFLVGTTNYLDRVDSRILRGGRFSEKIEIGAPDEAGYRRLLARYLGKARLADDLTLQMIVRRIHGMSPADLEATVNAMKRAAMRRMSPQARLSYRHLKLKTSKRRSFEGSLGLTRLPSAVGSIDKATVPSIGRRCPQWRASIL
jgi:SpoVK/Ycf46/Vps4 family AAA+-type ATPase